MSYLASRYPGGRRVLARDVIGRYGLERTVMARHLLPGRPGLSLWLVLGDLELDRLDLDQHRADARIGLTSTAAPHIHGLLVTGSLAVRGPVLGRGRPDGLSLFVLGDLRAGAAALSGVEVLIGGDTRVTDVLCCSGAELGGQVRFDGDLEARLMINAGGRLSLGGALRAPVLDAGTATIRTGSGNGVLAAGGDLPAQLVMAPEYLIEDPPRVALAQVLAAVEAGHSPLRAEFRAGRLDLEGFRERRELLARAESAMLKRRYTTAAGLFRTALARGAPPGQVGVRLVDALYGSFQLTGDRAGLHQALGVLDAYVAAADGGARDHDDDADLARVLVLRACVRLQLDEDDGGDLVERARADHERALELDPRRTRVSADDLAELLSLVGRALYERRRYAESVDVLRDALAERVTHEHANGTAARALWMVGREVEAIPYATRSLRVNPSDDFIWFVRGKCRQRLGDHGQARTDLRTYLDLHPEDEYAVEALVESAFDSHRPEIAVDEARRFAASQPWHADALARLGRLLRARGRPAEGVLLLRAALERDGASGVTRQRATRDLAVALLAGGGDVDGLERAMRTVELGSGSDHDHESYLLGECYRILGDLARAEAELSRYLDDRPDSPGAMASLAMVQLAAGRAEEAYQLIGEAGRLAPDDGYVQRCAAVLAA